MKYKDLSLKDRAELISLGVKNGIRDIDTIIQMYDNRDNKFGDGGDTSDDKEVPITVNEYITQRLEEIRRNALDNSRTRTLPKVPKILNEESEEDYNYKKESLTSNLDRLKQEKIVLERRINLGDVTALNRLNTVNQGIQAYEEWLGKPYEKYKEGASCLYTATDNYGKEYLVSGNQSFASNPGKYGFKKVEKIEMAPGDIVQDVSQGYPSHAMIYNGKNKSGVDTFNYSRGGSSEGDIIKGGTYRNVPLDVYRFVGTQKDSANFIQDYNRIYSNKFDEGGDTLKYTSGEQFGQERKNYFNNILRDSNSSKTNILLKANTQLLGADDNWNANWIAARAEARPDLINEEEKGMALNLLNTVKETKASKLAQQSEDYNNNNFSKYPWVNPDSEEDKSNFYKYFLEGTPTEQSIKNSPSTLGFYMPKTHSIIYNDYSPNLNIENTRTHERAHTYGRLFEKQVNDVLSKYDFMKDSYLDSNAEIYARLQEFRRALNIDPTKNYSIEDVNNLRKEYGDLDNFHMFNRYSDEMISDLLNNVAMIKADSPINFGKYGGRLNKFQDGGEKDELAGEDTKEKSWILKLLENGQSARDARIGAVGAQQVRDAYNSGNEELAQELSEKYYGANTSGIALGAGFAAPNLWTDLAITVATTMADAAPNYVLKDPYEATKQTVKDLAINAAGDILGKGAGYALEYGIKKGKDLYKTGIENVYKYVENLAETSTKKWLDKPVPMFKPLLDLSFPTKERDRLFRNAHLYNENQKDYIGLPLNLIPIKSDVNYKVPTIRQQLLNSIGKTKSITGELSAQAMHNGKDVTFFLEGFHPFSKTNAPRHIAAHELRHDIQDTFTASSKPKKTYAKFELPPLSQQRIYDHVHKEFEKGLDEKYLLYNALLGGLDNLNLKGVSKKLYDNSTKDHIWHKSLNEFDAELARFREIYKENKSWREMSQNTKAKIMKEMSKRFGISEDLVNEIAEVLSLHGYKYGGKLNKFDEGGNLVLRDESPIYNSWNSAIDDSWYKSVYDNLYVGTVPYRSMYKNKDANTKLNSSNSISEFIQTMYPIVEQSMIDKGRSLKNVDNMLTQMAYESNYGKSPRGNGYNLAGIKEFDESKSRTRHTDGEYYKNFEDYRDFADYYTDLINNRYEVENAEGLKDYVERLHGKNSSGKSYSTNSRYYRNMKNMKTFKKELNRYKKDN